MFRGYFKSEAYWSSQNYCTGGLISAMAKTFSHKLKYNLSQRAVNVLFSVVNFIVPSPKFTQKNKYAGGNFYEGTGAFRGETAQNAKWHLGFSVDTLLTGNELDGNHFVGGEIRTGRKTATEIYDDMRIRAAAVNDGVSGTVVFAALDLYGLANNDIREIRSRLAQFAKENGIVSVNLMSLHQHSVIDTFGMNGDLKEAFLRNPLKNLAGRTDIKNGKNPDFMENLYEVMAKTIKAAFENMEPGTLVFGAADAAVYVVDERPPFVNDTELNRLRFHPDDPQSRDTWIVNWCAHCGGNGSSNRQVTSDYPYYMEKEISEKANANFMMIPGAIQSNAMNKSSELLGLPKEHTAVDTMKAYGSAFTNLLSGISSADEKAVEPLLNIRHEQIFLPLRNRVMILAFKAGLFQHTLVKTGLFGYEMVSEIGYAEFGKNIAVALIPGELEPSLAYGSALGAGESWSGKAWEIPSIQEMVGADKKLMVFGLANDQMGYIVADTDFVPMLAPESVHVEIVSIDKHCASTMLNAFGKMVESIK